MKTSEPDILKQGKAFHRKVQEDWKRTAKDGKIIKEHTIPFHQVSSVLRRKKFGRLDLFVDELGNFVSVVEIKSTDWDRVKEANRKKLLASHRRQIWRYIKEYVDTKKTDVCPGIIYPHSPSSPGLKEMIENYLNDYGLQVVWYDDKD
jgi:hypothetical protein